MKKTFKHMAGLVRLYRRNARISQLNLSKRMGYKQGQFISNAENGKCSIPVEKMPELSVLIQCPLDELVDAAVKDHRESINLALINKLKGRSVYNQVNI